MTPTKPPPAPPAFPEDVLAFAKERGVTDYLGPVLDLTRQAFPGATVRVTLEIEAEMPQGFPDKVRADVAELLSARGGGQEGDSPCGPWC